MKNVKTAMLSSLCRHFWTKSREVHSSTNTHSSPEVKGKPDVTTASALVMKKKTLECAFCRENDRHEDSKADK